MQKGIFFLLFCLTACSKSEDVNTITLRAEVKDTLDISCNRPVLSFVEDSSQIRQFTSRQNLSYVVNKLPSNLNIAGKKLIVKVQNTEEFFPCNTLGIAHPQLDVLEAFAQ